MGTATIMLIGGAKSRVYDSSLKRRYDVFSVTSGKQGVSLALEISPQVIVLDAVSLRNSGERIVRLLQKSLPDQPAIIHIHPGTKSTASSDADVVLFPPLTSRKLVNNIERLLKVYEALEIVCGPFAANVSGRILRANGQEISLTPKQASLIELFFQNPNETLDRKTIMKKVWDTEYLGDTRTLDVHIRWLRKAIEPTPSRPRYLKTVRGVGYRLEIPDA